MRGFMGGRMIKKKGGITIIPFFMGKATGDFAMVFYMLALWIGIPSIVLYLREMFSD